MVQWYIGTLCLFLNKVCLFLIFAVEIFGRARFYVYLCILITTYIFPIRDNSCFIKIGQSSRFARIARFFKRGK